MKHPPANLFTPMLMLLAVGLIPLWIRSHFRYDDIELVGHQFSVEIIAGAGVLHLEIVRNISNQSVQISRDSGRVEDDGFEPIYFELKPIGAQLNREAEVDWHGFGYVRGDYDLNKTGEAESGLPVSPMIGAHVPDWSIVTLLCVLPVLWFLRFVRSRLTRPHSICIICGYDLRATPARCPECGTAVG